MGEGYTDIEGRENEGELTNGHEQKFSRSDHVDNTLRILEDLNHHLTFRLRSRL
jgi:hypothetical protein